MNPHMLKIQNIEKSLELERDPIKRLQQNQELRELLGKLERMKDRKISA